MFFLNCVLEKDEAAIESSEYNSTSVTDVDKRVKRRLLMGKIFLPLFCLYKICALFLCVSVIVYATSQKPHQIIMCFRKKSPLI